MTPFIEVQTTTATQEEAQRIAHALIEQRLAGCVHVIGPIECTYRWQGAVESAQEWQCIAKTRAELFPSLQAAIRELHSYEVPQIVAVPIVAGTEDYLGWLEENTKGA